VRKICVGYGASGAIQQEQPRSVTLGKRALGDLSFRKVIVKIVSAHVLSQCSQKQAVTDNRTFADGSKKVRKYLNLE
jgi:hypothetical protein